MSDERQKIIDKIRSMQAFAGDPGATPAEAATFAKKAAKLVAKYTISQQELEPDERSEIKPHRYHIHELTKWRMTVLTQVAMMFSCRAAFILPTSLELVEIVGRRLNAESTMETFKRLDKELCSACEKLYPHNTLGQIEARRGMAIGLSLKLQDIRKADVESTLPVVQEIKEVKEFMDTQMVTTSEEPDLALDSAGAINGYMRSGMVEIHKGVKE